MTYAARTAFVLLTMLATAALAGACSSDDPAPPKGQLMVVLKTDMQVPKDVSAVRIEVFAAGVIRHRDTYTLGPDGSHLKLPGTLAIIAGSDPSIPVKIRVVAFDGNAPKVLRETITTVPPDRIAALPMPISWLCWDEPAPLPPPEGQSLPDAETTCEAGNTCAAGSCVASEIESTTLADYTPANVFGGGTGPGALGTCFDTLACFGSGVLTPLDLATCSLKAPAGTEPLNVALVLKPGGPGICNDSTCLVALDRDPAEGWTLEADSVRLPKAVCDQVLDGKVLGVVTSSECETKTAAVPTCGPWSSVTSASGTFDGGASFDAGNPCWVGADGIHCGSAIGADPTKLYTCQNNQTVAEQTCGGSCVENPNGDDSCPLAAGFGQPCDPLTPCAPDFICLEQTSGAIGGEGPARGICTVECTNDPSACNPLAIPAPCVELGARDFCLESCTPGDPPSSKCQGRLDVACAPVVLSGGGSPATTCVPVCAADTDCPGQRCNLATGLCTGLPPPTGQDPFMSDCSASDAAASACASGLCLELSDPADDAGSSSLSFCSGRCRMGTPGACGFSGPAGDAGTSVIACTLPATDNAAEGDLGHCSELCNSMCDCSNPSLLCKPFNDQSLEQKYGALGSCVPYWEIPTGGC